MAERSLGSVELVGLRGEERRAWAEGLVALEAGARYPLGDDHFCIDHGADYFAFFDRLGEEERWVAHTEAGQVVATTSGVLRTLDDGDAWYLCDLKVADAWRGKHLPAQLGLRAAPRGLLRCRRGYGIAMDPPHASAQAHPMARRLQHFSLFRGGVLGQLVLFSLSAEEAARGAPLVARHRGTLSWLSLRGIKDIVLQSTQAPMPLLHAQFGPYGSGGETTPVEGAVHMVCVPRGDALDLALREQGFAPTASATVFHVGMRDTLLPHLLSSDI